MTPPLPLIVAIEPDRPQSLRLKAIARDPLHAELIVAAGTEAAFSALNGRVPDLVLVSLLLSPDEDAALANRLREMDASGTRVQTLVVPMLGTGRGESEQIQKGRQRRAPGPPVCDPRLFAAVVAEYLRRAPADRPQPDDPTEADAATDRTDEVIAATDAPIESPRTMAEPAREVSAKAIQPATTPVREAVTQEAWLPLPPAGNQTFPPIEGLTVAEPAAPPRPRPEDRSRGQRKRRRTRASAKSRRRQTVQDEWGFFDPEQCEFATLLERLRELTEQKTSRRG